MPISESYLQFVSKYIVIKFIPLFFKTIEVSLVKYPIEEISKLYVVFVLKLLIINLPEESVVVPYFEYLMFIYEYLTGSPFLLEIIFPFKKVCMFDLCAKQMEVKTSIIKNIFIADLSTYLSII